MYTKILAQGAKFGSGATFWTTLNVASPVPVHTCAGFKVDSRLVYVHVKYSKISSGDQQSIGRQRDGRQ